jgi:hypothetical protein
MSAGKVFFMSMTASSILFVSSKVLTLGCLDTAKTTEGLPLLDASPIFGAEPILTSATSSILMICPFDFLMMDLPISLHHWFFLFL